MLVGFSVWMCLYCAYAYRCVGVSNGTWTMSTSENSRQEIKERHKHTHAHDETMTTSTTTTDLDVQAFDFMKCLPFLVWLFTRLVNSFTHTYGERHNKRMNKWREKRWIHHAACCTFIVHLRVLDDVLLQITQHIYGNLISARINENDFPATFYVCVHSRRACVCIDLQQRCHTNRKW